MQALLTARSLGAQLHGHRAGTKRRTPLDCAWKPHTDSLGGMLDGAFAQDRKDN